MNEWTGDETAEAALTAIEADLRAAMRDVVDELEFGTDSRAVIAARTGGHSQCHTRYGQGAVFLITFGRDHKWRRCTGCGHRLPTPGRVLYQTRTRPWVAPFELAGRFRARHPRLWGGWGQVGGYPA